MIVLLALAAIGVGAVAFSGGGSSSSAGGEGAPWSVATISYYQVPPPPGETIPWVYSYTPGWLLGEGRPEANQWLELAGSLLGAASSALTPVIGPIASQAIATVGAVVGGLKLKQRWVTPVIAGGICGVWQLAALVDGKPEIDVMLRWGRDRWGPSGWSRWRGARDKTGSLPRIGHGPMPQSGDPAWRYVFDGVSKSTADNVRWLQPPGPAAPACYVAIAGSQTEVWIWVPARGGDAKDGPYTYQAEITTVYS